MGKAPGAPPRTGPAGDRPAEASSRPARPQDGQPHRPLPAAVQSGTSGLFLLGPATRLVPEDFEIGPLADARAAGGDEKAALAAAAALLSSVAAGAPQAGQVTEDSRDAVLDLLSPVGAPGQGPLAFRLGRPVTLPDGEISVNLRLLRGEGTAEGEMYMRRQDGRWLVADVQVNPAALAVARGKPEERFFPSPYRWLLGGASPGATE